MIQAKIPRWLSTRPIAHRGIFDNTIVPENSLAAFHAAVTANLPIELDVRLLADGHPVVFHDVKLKRMTGRIGCIEEHVSKDIQDFKLLDSDQKIPLLSEVLDFIGGKVPLLIEVKSERLKVGALENAIISALRCYDGEYALQSFNPLSLYHLRKKFPQACRGQLAGGQVGPLVGRLGQPHFIAYAIQSLPNRAITRARNRGTVILTWTVCNQEQLAKARALADNYIFEYSAGEEASAHD